MTAPIVVGILLALLLVLSLIRIGGLVEYSESGLTVKARLGSLKFTLYPRPPKEKKEQKKKKAKKKPAPTEKKGQAKQPKEEKAPPEGGKAELLLRFLPLACEAAGKFRRKLRIDRLNLDFIAAGGLDAASGALQFGRASAAMGTATALLENSFQVKDMHLRTNVDFSLTEPVVSLNAALSLTIGQCVCLGVWVGLRALKIVLSCRKEQKQAAAAASVTNGKE